MKRNAIITGANRGLGKAIVKRFAENGFDIWACARKADKEFESFLGDLSSRYNACIKPVYFDLSNTYEIKTAYKNICNEKKTIDILINNAGIGHMGLFQMTRFEEIHKIYDVNLFAPMYLTQLVLRNMCKQKYGRIVNVASTAASEIYEGNSIYGASKAALVSFTQSLAAEVYKYGITVNAIAPGLINTDMSTVFEGKDPQEPIRHTALERKIEPEEIADILLELLSEKMDIINGEVICINGGHR